MPNKPLTILAFLAFTLRLLGFLRRLCHTHATLPRLARPQLKRGEALMACHYEWPTNFNYLQQALFGQVRTNQVDAPTAMYQHCAANYYTLLLFAFSCIDVQSHPEARLVKLSRDHPTKPTQDTAQEANEDGRCKLQTNVIDPHKDEVRRAICKMGLVIVG